MIKENKKSLSLRQRAEEELKHKLLETPKSSTNSSLKKLSEADIREINDELELQKVELKLQNEELKDALNKAESAAALYDFSPVGYFTLSMDGTIEHLNISAASMLGEEHLVLEKRNIRNYLSPDSMADFDDLLQKAFTSTQKQSCELKIMGNQAQRHSTYLLVEAIVSNNGRCLLTAVDISKQKEAEVEVLKQKQFYEQIYLESSVSTLILDKDGWCVKINPKLSELFGVKAEDLEGKKYNIFKDASLINEGVIPHLNQVFKEGKPAAWDICFDTGLSAESQAIEVTNTNKQWLHIWSYPIFDEEGMLSHVIIQQTDITERKKDEQRLSDSEARYRKLFESTKDGIIIFDAHSENIVDVNSSFAQKLGYSQDELKNKTLLELGIFKNNSDLKEIIIKLKNGGFIRYDNITLITKKGKMLHVELTGNIYQVNDQKVIQCNIRNITERIIAEKEINTLKKAIEQGPSSIIITNAEGKIEFTNNKFTELTQYQPIDVMGKNPRIFNPGHLSDNEFTELWETLKQGKMWEGQVMNRRKDHTFFMEETSISAVKNTDGSISNYILIQNDISEKQQIINDLIQAKEKAEESDLLKTAFLANMSHEIRTPLNSIIGFSELMCDIEFDHDQLFHFARIINDSGIKLLSIISDIMDLSRIEAGGVKVEKRRLSANQLIANIQKEYMFKAIEKGIELRIDPSSTTEEIFVDSDENKLRQVLINFVGNAIKFTEKGFIDIGLEKEGDLVKIQVKDTGIGVADKFLVQIFERFRQVESAYTRKYGGNGLGLAISKALVELLGGEVGMNTEYGKGSNFYFTIPIAK